MDNQIIYNLARKGKMSDEPETKDLIFKLIMELATNDHKLPKDINQRQSVGLILRDYLYKKRNVVKLSETTIKEAKNKYSTYKGYAKLQLSLDFFQMTNDMFFEVYGFNYVPEGKVRDAARKLIDMQATMSMISDAYLKPSADLSINSMINEDLVKSIFKDPSIDVHAEDKLQAYPPTMRNLFRSGC